MCWLPDHQLLSCLYSTQLVHSSDKPTTGPTQEMSQQQQFPVFCHTCNSTLLAILSSETEELECTVCHGSFVETPEQGVEDFIQTGSSANHSATTETPARVAAAQQPSVVPLLNPDGGRPMGFVVRQTVPTDTLAGLLNSGGAGVNGGASAGAGVFHLNISNMLGQFAANALLGADGLHMQREQQAGAMTDVQLEAFLHNMLLNESSHAGAAPASDEKITALPLSLINSEEQLVGLEDCSITQEPFEVGDEVVSLQCGHKFKKDPIFQWLKMHNACPVCRVQI